MRIVFAVIVFFHGIFHLLGFIKGFKLAEVDRLNGEISKPEGFFWFVALILFVGSVVLVILNADWWWIIAAPAIVVSQVLIFLQWQDAKFGTIANIIILIVLVFAIAEWNFNNMVKKELKEFFTATVNEENLIDEEDLSKLPAVVRKWIHRSNVTGKPAYKTVNLNQTGEMMTTPDGKWMSFRAEQWFTTEKPGFIWQADVSMFPGICMKGRDKFTNGEGNMLIKLLSLFTVVDSKGDEINQGSLLRYIGELVWFPYAAMNDFYVWEEIDFVTAKITTTQKNITVSGIFKFSEEGDFLSFETQRYFDREEGATLETWLVKVNENGYRDFDGIRIPAELSVIWKLKEGDFNWLNLKITDLKYQ